MTGTVWTSPRPALVATACQCSLADHRSSAADRSVPVRLSQRWNLSRGWFHLPRFKYSNTLTMTLDLIVITQRQTTRMFYRYWLVYCCLTVAWHLHITESWESVQYYRQCNIPSWNTYCLRESCSMAVYSTHFVLRLAPARIFFSFSVQGSQS